MLLLLNWSFDSAISWKQGKEPHSHTSRNSNKLDFCQKSEGSPLFQEKDAASTWLADLGLCVRVPVPALCWLCWEGLSVGPCVPHLFPSVASLCHRQRAGKGPAGIIICPLVIHTVNIWQHLTLFMHYIITHSLHNGFIMQQWLCPCFTPFQEVLECNQWTEHPADCW